MGGQRVVAGPCGATASLVGSSKALAHAAARVGLEDVTPDERAQSRKTACSRLLSRGCPERAPPQRPRGLVAARAGSRGFRGPGAMGQGGRVWVSGSGGRGPGAGFHFGLMTAIYIDRGWSHPAKALKPLSCGHDR